MYSIKEVAAIIGVSDESVRRAIKDGNIHSVRLGARGKHRIPVESLSADLGMSVEEIERKAEQLKIK